MTNQVFYYFRANLLFHVAGQMKLKFGYQNDTAKKSELFLKQLPEKDFSKITYKGSNDENN